MKRFTRLIFSFLSLSIFCAWMSLPLVEAADVLEIPTCELSGTNPDYPEYQSVTKESGSDSWSSTLKGYLEKNNSLYEKMSSGAGTCGEADNGYLFKGDCTAEGKVITEITEILAPSKPDDDSSDEEKIIDVYHGICCMLDLKDGTNTTCEDKVSYYTKTLKDCEAAVNSSGADAQCEKRQWIIGTNGVGILKLYITQMYSWIVVMVGGVAVTMLVFYGIKISVSGMSGDISDAKQKITQIVLGIVLLFSSALILYVVNPDFFG